MELKRGNPNYIDKNSNETNNKSMEEFIKLYAIALEKKVEKICEFLKGDNFNQILDKMKIIKSDLADSNNVDSLLSMLSAKALPDIPFEPGEDWRKALDFSDLPIYPHYCRLNLIKYQDESIENSLISSLNILLNNARAINNEELVSKIEEIILNINDVNSLRKFKKMEDCLKRIEFENFENGTIEYRSFLRDIFIKVDALIQKIKDNNNPPYQDLDIMSNINKIIKAEDNEEI